LEVLIQWAEGIVQGSQSVPRIAAALPGIQVEEGKFTGCAYGYGDRPPYSGPRDCPVCGDSGIEGDNQPN